MNAGKKSYLGEQAYYFTDSYKKQGTKMYFKTARVVTETDMPEDVAY